MRHTGGSTGYPIGTVRVRKDGSGRQAWVKVSYDHTAKNGGWRQRSHIVWERDNGRPLPEGWCVLHANGDKLDDSWQNLIALPHRHANALWSEQQRALTGKSGIQRAAELGAQVIRAASLAKGPRGVWTCSLCAFTKVQHHRPRANCPKCGRYAWQGRHLRPDRHKPERKNNA